MVSWLYFAVTIQVTYAPIVPPIVLFLAKHPLVDKYDLSTVETLHAEPLPWAKDLRRRSSNECHK